MPEASDREKSGQGKRKSEFNLSLILSKVRELVSFADQMLLECLQFFYTIVHPIQVSGATQGRGLMNKVVVRV